VLSGSFERGGCSERSPSLEPESSDLLRHARGASSQLIGRGGFGDEVGEASLGFGAGERLGTLAGHGIAAVTSLKACVVNVWQ